jgi:flagellar hook assembly protein FlgD
MSDPVAVTTPAWGAQAVQLLAVGPSPARGDVVVSFSVPQPEPVRLDVYDASGRLIRQLEDGEEAKGDHSTTWRARDQEGRPVASGVYFVEVADAHGTQTRKIVLQR